MTFDIHQLDGVDPCSEVAEEALEKYQGEVRELFLSSPEGQEFLRQFPDAGSWIDHLIHFGFHYVGVTLAHMKEPDLREIVTDIFPRKVSLSEEEEAEGAIDELIAFWKFLQRQFDLQAAPSIIEFLEHIQPEFVNMMFDPSNFGMGKSLFMMAKSSGYDMTNKADVEKFILEFNSNKEMQNNTDFPTLNIDVPDQSYDRVPQPVVRKEKLGRNEPCSCGSGKKYKKCCGS